MKLFNFILSILISVNGFCQYRCELNGSPNSIVIQGSGNTNKIDIKSMPCNNCNITIYYSEGTKSMVYKAQSTVVLNRGELENVSSASSAARQLASDIIAKSAIDCAKPLAIGKIQSGDYKISTDSNSVSVTINDITEDELTKTGLKITFGNKGGITRVKELGRYYYLDSTFNPIRIVYGEAERYDTATDFIDGSAIVGIRSPEMIYYLVNKKGEKSKFSFHKFEENFAGFQDLLKITSDREEILLNRSMERVGSPNYTSRSLGDSLIEQLSGSFPVRHYLMTYRNHSLAFVLPDSYQDMQYFGCHLLYVEKKETRKEKKPYRLVDLKSKAIVYLSESELHLDKTDTSGVTFVEHGVYVHSDYKGYFDNLSRKLLPPKYSTISRVTGTNFLSITVSKDRWSSYTDMASLIDLDGHRRTDDFDFIGDSINRFGLIQFTRSLYGAKGYIDTNNNIIINPDFARSTAFDKNGLLWANNYGDLKLLDTSGKNLLDSKISLDYRYELNKISPFSASGYTIIENKIDSLTTKYHLVTQKGKVLVLDHNKKPVVSQTPIKDVLMISDSTNFVRYFKDGDIYPAGTDVIFRQFKNGFAVAKCTNQGYCLIDSSGRRYPEKPFCMPYDSLSDVINGLYTIVTNDNKKGIVHILTGEIYLVVSMDKIEAVNDTYVCTQGTRSFVVSASPKNKVLQFISGDSELYRQVIFNRS